MNTYKVQTVTENLKHLETGIQDIASNVRTKIDELARGTTEMITDMRKDLEQGSTVVSKLLKTINSLRPTSSTLSPATTSSSTTPMASSTIITEPTSSPSFLQKEKVMQELKTKLLSKKTITITTQIKKFVPFDICDPFVSGY